MDRVSAANYATVGGLRMYQDLNLGANQQGTEIASLWLNGAQESLLAPVTAVGLVPTDSNNLQLLQAIEMIAYGAVAIDVVAQQTYTYVAGDMAHLKRRSNAGALMLDNLPGPGTGVLPNLTGFSVRNADASGLLCINLSNSVALDGGAAPLLLGPGQVARIISDGTNYHTLIRPGRARLGGNLNLYVATTGSDSNNGLTSGTPFLTLQHAWNFIANDIDLNGFAVTVNVANGTYTAGVICSGVPPGWLGVPNVGGQAGPSVIFLGDPSSPTSCSVNVANGNCFQASAGAQIVVNGFALTAGGIPANYNQVGIGLYAFGSGAIEFANVNFGACSVSHIASTVSSTIQTSGAAYTISGGAQYHAEVFDSSYLTLSNSTITLTGTPAFSQAFIFAFNNGVSATGNNVFNGAATGPKYSASANGVINTGGGGASYFPGSVAGTTGSGGQYL